MANMCFGNFPLTDAVAAEAVVVCAEFYEGLKNAQDPEAREEWKELNDRELLDELSVRVEGAEGIARQYLMAAIEMLRASGA